MSDTTDCLVTALADGERIEEAFAVAVVARRRRAVGEELGQVLGARCRHQPANTFRLLRHKMFIPLLYLKVGESINKDTRNVRLEQIDL